MAGLLDIDDDDAFPQWRPRNQMTQPGGNYEQLPGVTSGAPPKPWGLDRDQLALLMDAQQRRNALAEKAKQDQAIMQQWYNTYLGRVLPQPDYSVDPGALVGPRNSPRMPEVNWMRWSLPPNDTNT